MNAENRTQIVLKVLAILLLILTLLVSVPLTIRIWREEGGPWGFGIIGLHILLPLNAYLLFSWAALVRNPTFRWWIFLGAHGVSVVIGIIGFFLFPVMPKALLLIPLALALASVIGKKRISIFLALMLLLGATANTVLLKWELEFGRTFPIIELFRSPREVDARDVF